MNCPDCNTPVADGEPCPVCAAIRATTERLESVLRESRKDEAMLKRILAARRLRRRLAAAHVELGGSD